ncbi:hypothetical protein BN10_1320021 [Phycicoccus elongatus Lp2]|uniref:asparagine synthase (glutamine-hydrolyzing) n=1 Tax=Phycicoccus elongatus Lp2 TaxID=1193181 RepID=N0DY64_9MICO|nr:hypothetical protein BN10_1320021 [Phycicoccus elongatus Lp2]
MGATIVEHIGPARETWHAWSPAACPCPTARTKNEELPVCGIVGFHGHDDRDLLQAMNDQLVHRGPDGDGIFLDGTVGLGHRRLTIIDTSHEADQPMWSADRRAVRDHLQRRDLQLPRAQGRAGGQGAPVPLPVRHRGDPRGVCRVGPGRAPAPPGDVCLRALRHDHR